MKDEPEETAAAGGGQRMTIEELNERMSKVAESQPPGMSLYAFMMLTNEILKDLAGKDLLFQALHDKNTVFLDKDKRAKYFYGVLDECFSDGGSDYSAYNILVQLLEEMPKFEDNPKGFYSRAEELLAKYRQEEENQPYLTGLEPKEKNNLPLVPSFIRNPYTMIAMAQAAREVDSFNFEITPQGTGAKIPIDNKGHHVYLLFPGTTNTHPITTLDKRILTALSNLYYTRINETADKVAVNITAEDIIRTDRGYDSRDTVTQAEIDEVTERMNYLINLSAVMDFTEHYNLYKMEDVKQSGESKMVQAIIFKTRDHRGNIIHTSWRLYAPPELFNYAMQIKQFATINTDLLDLRIRGKKTAKNSPGALDLRTYLLERILAMIDRRTQTKKNKMSNVIKLESIVNYFHFTFNSNAAKKRKIDTIKNILEKFKITADKHRGTFIKDYKIIIEKRAITGFEIFF